MYSVIAYTGLGTNLVSIMRGNLILLSGNKLLKLLRRFRFSQRHNIRLFCGIRLSINITEIIVKISILIALFIAVVSFGDVIDLSDGGSYSGGEINFENGKFVLDGETFDREEVSRIIIGKPADIETQKAPIAEAYAEMATAPEILLEAAENAESKYPDAAGIVIIDHGTNILRENGTRVYRYHFAGKILKSSKLHWGQSARYFEDGRSRARILFERTITPENEHFWWDTTQYTITEPSEGGVFFDYGKTYSAMFPQVSVGSIVEYISESETYNPFDKNFFTPYFYFQDDVPTLESRCTVIIPKDRELNFRNYNWPNGNDSPTITETETTRVYEWVVENSPPFIEEIKAPSYGDLVPRYDATLFQNWDYIYDWLGELQRNRMVATPEIKSVVAEIVEGATDMPDSINRIYIWVQQEIHYISIKGSVASGETGHTAKWTFEKKYGDCTDKSILLATMLREIGVEAYPIIVMTNDEEDVPRDIPDLSGNHAITLAIVDGKRYFLDATTTSYNFPYFRSDCVGVTYVCALCRDWDTVYTPTPDENAIHIEINATLDIEGNLTADYISSLVGDYEGSYRGYWEYRQADRRGVIMQDWISYIIPGAQVTDWSLPGVDDLSVPFQERVSFRVPKYTITAGDLWIIKIPQIEKDYQFEEVSLAKRRFPIEYTAPYKMSHKITIEIPEDFAIEYLPGNIELDNPYTAYRANYRKEGDSIIFEDEYRLKKRIVPVEDYKSYKKFCRSVSEYARKQVFLRSE
ncbi:hypothetical protein DRQ36_08355 [bacterium]|nr:MAG: hypothetical protein DRQ36_08355 [bacterium]